MRLGIIAIMAAPLAACLTLSSARAQPDCANWNSSAFFATAGAADVRACLRAGADPGARDKDGNTPMHAAAVAALFEAGSDPDARDKYDATPLHHAAHNGHAAAIDALLKGGADPDARDKYGATPFDVIAKELIGTPVYRRLKDARRI